MDNEKKNTELEMLRLQNKLYKAEKKLAEKENVIIVKEKEIEILETKMKLAEKENNILVKEKEIKTLADSKNAEIQTLKNENKALKRGQRLSRSFSSLSMSEKDEDS